MTRLFFDLTSLVNWRGPVVGIIRAQQEYALYARLSVPEAAFTIFDYRASVHRQIREPFVDGMLAGRIKPHLGFAPPPGDRKRRFVKLVPKALQGAYFWISRSRRKLLLLAESKRLSAGRPADAARWERLQRKLLQPRLRRMFFDESDRRIDVPALDDVLMAYAPPGIDDLRVAVQFDWTHTAVDAVLDERDRAGSRYVAMCHDIIPLLFPKWYEDHDVRSFRHHFDAVFARGDDVMTTSQSNARDITAYCARSGFPSRSIPIVPLGALPLKQDAGRVPLPDGLEREKYALFVSTIEPRKNHAMLVEAWRTLVGEGLIARSGFKLVFVGRDGWMMGDFIRKVEADPALSGTVIRLQNVSDAMLASLYDGASFCLYPPIYEGFGLPPLEALQRGKAQIVSAAGPMPEVVGDFAIKLDPGDGAAWTHRMRNWIAGSPEREQIAARARSDFRAMTWDESAKHFFDTVLARHEAALEQRRASA